MKFKAPQSTVEFEISDECIARAAVSGFLAPTPHYKTAQAEPQVAPIAQFEPPLRTGGIVWFRDDETVINMLIAMRDGVELPPIEVWSFEKSGAPKYKVRNGVHRFYLSIALGFSEIPYLVNDFDLDEWLEKERRGEL